MNIAPEPDYIAPGEVLLVGAGPGDPELITIAAWKALKGADVVVHDALISEELLDEIPPGCQKIFVGKRGGHVSTNQEAICDLLVDLARQGKRVARLKGGDPFVFGRGGEEALRLAEAGIPFRVIPGLTAGVAAPAYAGIPITHRGVNANVAFLTGHEAPENVPDGDGGGTRIDWEAVGRAFPVLVLYMAMHNLAHVTQRLMAAGRSPDTPMAIIRWATTPDQSTLITTLGQAVSDVQAHGFKPPAIIVIGDVVKFRQQLKWHNEVEPVRTQPNQE
jgi:uroporphyrin-III C-methyltransferase